MKTVPENVPPSGHRPASVSRRRQQLRLTFTLMISLAALGLIAGGIFSVLNRSQPYQPGEDHRELTRRLARGLPADAPPPRFTDVTEAAGLSAFRTFHGERSSQLPEDMGPGAAWGDFNNNGLDDLFLVSAGGPLHLSPDQLAPSELYENLGNGAFRKVAGFPDLRIHGMAAAWADYNLDGYLDLVVTGYDALYLFRNEGGSGRFTRDTNFPALPGYWAGVAWGDYNRDGYVDLYVCGYIQYDATEADLAKTSFHNAEFVPFALNPISYPGAANLLFRNNGDGAFTEVAEELGVANPNGKSLAAVWHDFDGDGWLDLYVANDVSDNVFFRNVNGTFEDISHPAWIADYRSAMGMAIGDWDRDGDDDLFITHWVAQENAFFENLLADFSRATNSPKSAEGTLTSAPKLRFMDIADRVGLGQISIPAVGWGTEFVDLDGDGWLDLVVANGNTLEFRSPPGAPKKLKPQEPFLFWNRRGHHFYNLAPLSEVLSQAHVSRGLAVADYNQNGAMDILLVHLGEGVQLLRNEMQTGNWLKLQLRNRLPNGAPLGFAEGAQVTAHVQGALLRRSISSVSYLSQSSRTLHFGLGGATDASVEIRWPNGRTEIHHGLQANSTYTIVEGDPSPKPRPKQPATHASSPGAPPQTDRDRLRQFWAKQRAAMDALKMAEDIPLAIRLLREALQLDPSHQDSLYYLGQCLARQGDISGALAQFDEIIRLNSQSHRGFQQAGFLRAAHASSFGELAAAEELLERAHAINSHETGALLILGEISLLQKKEEAAERRLFATGRTNPRATGAFFLRAYLAWRQGRETESISLLKEARESLGKDWHPEGAAAEGEVKKKMHLETTLLSNFWESWDGEPDPETAFKELHDYVLEKHFPTPSNL
jgi:enediyne biosynthesis protein E4